MEITSYIQAAFPAVCVETVEEQRFIDELRTSIASASDTYHIYQIDARSHLYEWRNSMPIATDGRCDYGKAFELVADKQFAILIALDWQHICHNANAYRKLKSQFDKLKANGSCIILISPSWKLPDELTHDIPVVDYALPDRQQLQQQLNLVVKSASTELDDDNHARECLNAAAGLTLAEADNTFALSFVKSRRINPKIIEQEKMNLVRSSGYLEVWPAEPIENVGGLDTLKDYFTQEVIPAKDDAELQRNEQDAASGWKIPARDWVQRTATQKECCKECRPDKHVDVFTHEKERPSHRRIFCVPSTYEFLFRLSKIKGCSIRFCKQADVKQNRNKRLLQNVPLPFELLSNNRLWK